ncbi:MAG: YicC/YloC family endoribonuclease [Bacteroidota bacterium]
MTGYGNAKGQVGGQSVSVEIRSLNSKFLELNLRLPLNFRDRELELRADLGKQIERGKADLVVNIENNDLARRSSINRDIFDAYFNELSSIGKEYHLSDVNLFDIILKMPAVMNTDRTEADASQWTELQALIAYAVGKFNAFRDNEGRTLQADLSGRISTILEAVVRVEESEHTRVASVRARLERGLLEVQDQAGIDRNRFEQELIYYIEKLDISEEKVRLRSHIDYFRSAMDSPEANGKKLGFIAQEIGREINTIGSKANDASIQRIVVEMKDELEKIKEQLANLL